MQSEQAELQTEQWIMVSTILASSMAFIDGSALNVTLPAIQTSLQASGSQLLWIINGYALMLAALILAGGSLGDRLGRKRVFMAGIALFGLASLGCGISPTTRWLIAARVVQGVGGALMIPGSLAIINASIHPGRRGKAIGTWSAVTTLVTVAGPVLGGFLADRGLWRAVFMINLPLGIFALAALYWKVPESYDPTAAGRIDFGGALLATLGLAGLTYGFITAADVGFADPRIWGALLAGAAALIAFAILEARSRNPMLPLKLFRSRTFSGTNLLTLFLYGALSVISFFLSLNLIQAQGYSKTAAGFAFLPFIFFLGALSRWAGGLVDRRGPRLPLIIGPAVTGLGMAALAFSGLTDGPSGYWRAFLPGIALMGVGMGITVAPLTTAVMGSVADTYSGTASGINNAVSRTAGVLAVAVLGAAALLVFAGRLAGQTASLNLTPAARQALQREAGKLGDASVPPEVSDSDAAQVGMAIKLAFVDTFRLVALVCAGLAWVSALFAALLVEGNLTTRSAKDTKEKS